MRLKAILAILFVGISLSSGLEILDPSALGNPAEDRQTTNCGIPNSIFFPKGASASFSSPNFPNRYFASAACMWTWETTTDATFSLTCNVSVPCTGDYFMVSRAGDTTFQLNTTAYCGAGVLTTTSISNKMTNYLKSMWNTVGGTVSCRIVSVASTTNMTVTTTTTTTQAPTPSPSCACGTKGPNRIVGGVLTNGIQEYPWTVAFLNNMAPICGAAIIAPSWVITAAHCTAGLTASSIQILAGRFNFSATSSTQQFRSVSRIIQHPSYNPNTLDNDISLLQLSSPLTYTAAVQPICLPLRYAASTFQNQVAIATGWGRTSDGGTSSNSLMKVNLNVLTTTQCKSFTNNVGPFITNNMFCAYADGKDTCQGDSGGPLNWIDPSTGKVHLIGITSWGIGCARLNSPGVYTKVTNYLSWIQTNTAQTFCTA